jgi:hypothetical protein
MLNLIKPRHLSLLKKHAKKEQQPDCPEAASTHASAPAKKTHHFFKKMHYNATRTKVTQFLDHRAEKIRMMQHPSFWLLSRAYLKRLTQFSPEKSGENQASARRKISWSEESEFVVFNQRKNSASISDAPRNIYNLEL